MKHVKYLLVWIVSILLTISISIYQRITGPTYPYSSTIEINGKLVKLDLVRSHGGSSDAAIFLPITDGNVRAFIKYKKYPSKDKWVEDSLIRTNQGLSYSLPHQPPAGKLKYTIEIHDGDNKIVLPTQIIRFKGAVPSCWLIPHILFMFLALLFSFSTGISAAFNIPVFKGYAKLTAGFLFMGGLLFGPIVQKYAFGDLWTGIPFGWDLTDNKTLIAAIFWIIALYKNYKNPSRFWTIIASVVIILIYAVPHSLFGSELDTETGKVVQGGVAFLLCRFNKSFKYNSKKN